MSGHLVLRRLRDFTAFTGEVALRLRCVGCETTWPSALVRSAGATLARGRSAGLLRFFSCPRFAGQQVAAHCEPR